MPRLACLSVPLFPLAARLRAEPELAAQVVAVCEGNGPAARVTAASRLARKAGVAAGMTLAQARSVLPGLVARGRNPLSERSAHEALLETAWSLSPRVEDADEDLVFADVSGMERLFADDVELGHAALKTARSVGLPVRVGVADTKLAARIAARLPASPVVVPPGQEAAFLAPLPLQLLELDHRLAGTLRRWGISTVGELARLPADRVTARLGAAGAAAHQASRGLDPLPLVPLSAPPVLSEGMELEWPVVTLEPLLCAVRQSLERCSARLANDGKACILLELELALEPEGRERRAIRLPLPTREVEALVDLIQLELEARPPQAPVTAFTCVLHPAEPRRGQLTLFGPPELSPERLASTLARLAGRLGPERVVSPHTIDGHLPERFAVAGFDPPPPPRSRQAPGRSHGLLAVRVLRPPVALEVIGEEREPPGDGPRLLSVASLAGAAPHIQGLVRVAAGPWRLEEGWWEEQPVARDYWDVELSDGGLYRLFRDAVSGSWFADGMYD